MPRTISVEQHAVFVTLEDGSKHRVSEWMDWTEAIDTWTAMDDQRRDALKVKGIIESHGLRIKHYEVRSENDPNYANLPERNLARGFRVLSREYTTDIAAAKAVLKPLGYYAKEGGWVYYQRKSNGHEHALAQGWVRAAEVTGHAVIRQWKRDEGSLVTKTTGYRAVVTRALQVKVEKVGA